MSTKKTKKAVSAFPTLPILATDNIYISNTATHWKIEMDKDANGIALIRIIKRDTGAINEYKFATNNGMLIRFGTGAVPKLQLDTFTNFPPSLQYDLIQKGQMVPFFDIVKNNIAFPAGTFFKIIGTDSDRHVNKTTCPYSIMNLQTNSWIYIKYVPASGGNELYYQIAATDSVIKTKGEDPVMITVADIIYDSQA